jgi:AraC-like DNA-binding protein
MSVLEAAIRGGAVTVLLLAATLLLRDRRQVPTRLYSALFALSVAAYVIASAPGFDGLDLRWRIPIGLASSGTPAAFWLAAAAYFEDDFKPSLYRVLGWLGLVLLGLWQMLGQQPIAYFLHHGLSLMFIVLAAWQTFIGRDADLVEGRRRFRLVLVVSTALYTAGIIVSQWLLPGSETSAPFSLINAVGLLALVFVYAAARLSVSATGQFATSDIPAQSPSSPREIRPSDSALATDANEQDAALLKALDDLMKNNKVYREEGLSIVVLSAKLSIPEYRLRRLINQKLGHRNFSAFVNSYRLSEAMAALSDPSQSSVPVLTIALDTGFGSIGPFNRAFKAHTGMTPTEYRREHTNGMRKAPSDLSPISESASPVEELTSRR